MSDRKRLYGEISKIDPQDDGTVKVYGYASAETKDAQGDTVKAEAMRAALPDYLKWANVREMHDAKAAGTCIEAEVQDDGRTWFGAHVVDTEACKKVVHKVYKGFSIGGNVLKRDPDDKNIITGIKLVEVSLVDRPANPDAVFVMHKLDEGLSSGSKEIDELSKLLDSGTVTPAQLLELAKTAVAPTPVAADPAPAAATVSAAPAADPKAAEPAAKAAVADPAPAPEAVAAKADGATAAATTENYTTPPDGISKAAWDSLSEAGRAHVLAKGKTPEVVAAAAAVVETDPIKLHNAAVEKRARAIATTAFEKGDAASKAGRVADADWMNYVGEATRLVKAEEAELAKAATAAPKAADAKPAAEDAKKADAAEDLKKGMYNVQSFASALESLSYIAYSAQTDFDYEGDSSPVPAQLRAWIAAGVAIFQAMATEESNELVATLKGASTTAVMAMADRAEMTKRVNAADLTVAEAVDFAKKYLPAADLVKASFETIVPELKKYGARHSQTDLAHLQNAHDSLVKCGASCGAEAGRPGADVTQGPKTSNQDTGNADVTPTTTVKADSPGNLLKAATDNALMKRDLEDRNATITKRDDEIKRLNGLLEKSETMLANAVKPMPIKGRLFAFSKGHEIAEAEPTAADKTAAEALAKSTPGQHNPEAAQLLIKAALTGAGAGRVDP